MHRKRCRRLKTQASGWTATCVTKKSTTKLNSSKNTKTRKTTKEKIIKDDENEQIKHVAYGFERQLGNFIYQSLEECNNNIKLAVGEQGLEQILTKQQGKLTYQFNDDKFARRFKLPELYNWGAKIAKIIDIAIKSSGPVFIYTNFINSGAKPIAIALENWNTLPAF